VRLDETVVRAAAALLPKAQRATRREEWSADLEHCAELGLTRREVTAGVLAAALADGLGWRTPIGRSRWLAAGSIVVVLGLASVPVSAVAAYAIDRARGVVTTELGADGTTREVHWKDYPGRVDHGPNGWTEVDPAGLLAAPSAEEALADAQALVTALEGALSAEFGLEWPSSARVAWPYEPYPMQNGYGGASLLVTLNSPASLSARVDAAQLPRERALEVLAEVAGRHGYGPPVLDFDRPWFGADEARAFGGDTLETAAIAPGLIEGPHGAWLAFSIEDPSRLDDPDAAHPGAADIGDEESGARVTLAWGATLLPAAAREEFAARLRAFTDYPRPEPLISD